eukprot:CAMPEP_0114410466 /NCGR_PEP_ID=MMETSP0102-20121206/24054_1 /TAXON_ID=38822 ORGANISM="Pteridomonas danica, Strain PT" /NCGR_SAMPLE_ID=MMETSP0102 /ASSEMBLY_ACC=CAM_ASM_000212 /LENGTH=481 /DNA_ID=CAMNT_0001578129 /DNA_START=6 /DNA_END=1451 /DNA_ORIENTATION=+
MAFSSSPNSLSFRPPSPPLPSPPPGAQTPSTATASLARLVGQHKKNGKRRRKKGGEVEGGGTEDEKEEEEIVDNDVYRSQKHIKRAWNQLYRGAIVIKSLPTSATSSSFSLKLSKRYFVTIKQDSSRNEKIGASSRNKCGMNGGVGNLSRSQGRDPDSFIEGLSSLTQVIIESSGAETEPIEISLTANELKEVISKYQIELVKNIIHPVRNPPTIKTPTDLSSLYNDVFNINKALSINPDESFVKTKEPIHQIKSLTLSHNISNEEDEENDEYELPENGNNNDNNNDNDDDNDENNDGGIGFFKDWIDDEYRIGPDFVLTGKELDLLSPDFGRVRQRDELLEREEERKREREAFAALNRPKPKRNMNEQVANKVQAKLRAAVINNDPRVFFQKYDKDKGGSLDATEFKKCIRQALKIPPSDLSDKDIEQFTQDLDDDGSGDLDIDELADFVERGMAWQRLVKQCLMTMFERVCSNGAKEII